MNIVIDKMVSEVHSSPNTRLDSDDNMEVNTVIDAELYPCIDFIEEVSIPFTIP